MPDAPDRPALSEADAARALRDLSFDELLHLRDRGWVRPEERTGERLRPGGRPRVAPDGPMSDAARLATADGRVFQLRHYTWPVWDWEDDGEDVGR